MPLPSPTRSGETGEPPVATHLWFKSPGTNHELPCLSPTTCACLCSYYPSTLCWIEPCLVLDVNSGSDLLYDSG